MNVPSRLAAYTKEQLVSVVSLILVFISLAVLSAFFFSGEKKRSLMFLELKAEETAFALLDYYRQGITSEAEEFERLSGFAVYGPNGRASIGAGNYPDSLDIGDFGDRSSVYTIDRRAGTVAVTKLLGMFPAFPATPGGTGRMHGMVRPQRSTAIYVEVIVSDLLSPYRWYSVAQIAVPTTLAILFGLILIILLRNWEFRRQLESQRHLVFLGQAARTLSHEIKNPLSAIQIQAAILRKTISANPAKPATSADSADPAGSSDSAGHADPAYGATPAGSADPAYGATSADSADATVAADSIRVIDEEVERLRLLTDRVDEFLRNPEGSPEEIDVTAFIDDIIGRLPWKVGIAGFDRGPFHVRFDPGRFRSVVENLIRNAAESYADSEADYDAAIGVAPTAPSPEPAVAVRCSAEHSTVVISILDRGEGIAPHDLERVFDPFYTTKIHGSGIGLAITRRFVEAAGGTVTLSPRDGGGTGATIVLPKAGK